jgi:hypothetical protein
MNLHCLRHLGCVFSAPPMHVAVQPSCKPSPPEHRHRSASRAGKAEGKIEGGGTAMCPKPGLHEGGRGTRGSCSRAASKSNAALLLASPRAVFAAMISAAMELRHGQP